MSCYQTPRAAVPLQKRRTGFTLIEMMVSLVLMTMLILAAFELFDMGGKMARAQTNISDMQQSLRAAQYDVVRLIRMAGRGPLPLRTAGRSMPTGVPLEVFNNVPVDREVILIEGSGQLVDMPRDES